MTIAKPRRKPVQRETAFHMMVARYLDAALPPSCWWTTFPAGGGGKARGGKLKAMGLKAGVPDILVLSPACLGETDIVWLELKASKGKPPPPVQRELHRRLEIFDRVAVHVCRSIEEVEGALLGEGIPLNARARA